VLERGGQGGGMAPWSLVPVRTVAELARLLDPDWLGPDALELEEYLLRRILVYQPKD
jgi:hypothetical protein